MITNREKREGYIADIKRVEEVMQTRSGNIRELLTEREAGHGIFDQGCSLNFAIQSAAESMLGNLEVLKEILHIHYLVEQLLIDFNPDFVDDLLGISASELFDDRDPEQDEPDIASMYLQAAAEGAVEWLRLISPTDDRIFHVNKIIDMLMDVAKRIST